MVELLGYTATAVNESRTALDLFKDNPNTYDLVLTDQTMPGMTGIDLTRELTRIRDDIPVALITGYRDSVDAKAARAAGVALIVPKPMTKNDLGLAIKDLLARHGH
jgi:two-component system cell cycle sensor histidine kinase/response regulator CckA